MLKALNDIMGATQWGILHFFFQNQISLQQKVLQGLGRSHLKAKAM